MKVLLLLLSLLGPVPEESALCLSQNIYLEARSESINGQIAVAYTTLNRVDSTRYPNTICEVVWQHKQFSWTHDGKPDRPANNRIERRAWEQSQMLAILFIQTWELIKHFDPTGGSMYYHNDTVEPVWTASMVQTTKIDNHTFYRRAVH